MCNIFFDTPRKKRVSSGRGRYLEERVSTGGYQMTQAIRDFRKTIFINKRYHNSRNSPIFILYVIEKKYLRPSTREAAKKKFF